MKTFHAFKDIDSFQKFLRTKYHFCHKGGCLDYVTIGKTLYTMHEYDTDGQVMTWYNKRSNSMIQLDTVDRYKYGYHDAIVFEFPALFVRNDVAFAD